MGRHVSPRIAYWTSSFEPHLEAIASEVALLRQAFPSSVAWGMSHRRWALLSRRRGYCLHPRLHLLFRLATRLLERERAATTRLRPSRAKRRRRLISARNRCWCHLRADGLAMNDRRTVRHFYVLK